MGNKARIKGGFAQYMQVPAVSQASWTGLSKLVITVWVGGIALVFRWWGDTTMAMHVCLSSGNSCAQWNAIIPKHLGSLICDLWG